jgi:hypothetical protein
LAVTVVRYSTVKACDEVLRGFSAEGYESSIAHWSAPGRVPWFGAELADEAQRVLAEVLSEEPNAALGLTDPRGEPWSIPYADVRDIVAGSLLALESNAAIGQIFNIGASFSTPFTQGAKLVSEHTDRPYREVQMPFLWAYYSSIRKARAVLGYDPEYDFPRMVDDAVAFKSGKDIGVIPA